jgi:hypothetical protein
MMIAKTPLCLHCGDPIKSGRSDKKFCHSGCKDAYYNQIKSAEQAEISKIDLVLKRNRRVLKQLFNPQKDTIVEREVMIREGFEFGFHTHIGITKLKKNEIIFCYDYGYREIEGGRYQLFQSYSKVQVKDGYTIKL